MTTATLATATTPRYTVNPDGTVTDHVNQLVWTQTLGKNLTFKKAEAAIAKLGEDWRLPTTNELNSLVDRTHHSPAIDTEFFPDTEQDCYWTGDVCAWSPTSAVWVVHFAYGHVVGYDRDHGACLRACRSLPASQ